jgi:serine/threonine protein kinase
VRNSKCKYDVINTLYEQCKKAAYVIKSKDMNVSYTMKVKSKDLDNYNEITVFDHMLELHHPNIIRFIEYYESPECYNFIYEYINGVNLTDYIHKYELNDKIIKRIFSQVLSGVKFLHDNRVIHCDLKMENVVISSDGGVKIIDFDMARVCLDSMECITDVVIGTDGYISPESYDLCVYSPKSDVWAIGVMLHIVITGEFPFDQSTDDSGMYRRNKFKHLNTYVIKHAVKHKHYSPDLVKIVKKMLKFNDEERAGIDEINLKFNQ